MKKTWMVLVALASMFLWGAVTASAATYYVDYAGGNDTNAGTSKTAAWQHAPGMAKCIANCASASLSPGDSVILKGGVTWTLGGCWHLQWSGSSGNPVYIGVDKTWYSGASWSRPVLSAGGVGLGACVVNSGYTTIHNVMVALWAWNGGGTNYITIDNLEFTGFNTAAGGETHMIDMSAGGDYWTIENCYFHGWTAPAANSDPLKVIYRSTSPSYPLTSGILDHDVFDGWDTPPVQADPNCTGACQGEGRAFYGLATMVRYCIFRYVADGVVGSINVAHDNLFEYLRLSTDPNQHENNFENNSDCNTRFYNNVLRHWNSTSIVGVWLTPGAGCTDYAFNNVIYDTANANLWRMGNGPSQTGTPWSINNTIQAGADPTPSGVIQPAVAAQSPSSQVMNDLVITSVSSYAENCPSANCVLTTNLHVDGPKATADGYSSSQSYPFSPTSAGSPTVGVGTNETSLCSVDSDLAHLCYDTTLAVRYDETNHTAVGPVRTPIARPTTGAWDIGAYQFPGAGTTDSQVQPPTNLQAVVQ